MASRDAESESHSRNEGGSRLVAGMWEAARTVKELAESPMGAAAEYQGYTWPACLLTCSRRAYMASIPSIYNLIRVTGRPAFQRVITKGVKASLAPPWPAGARGEGASCGGRLQQMWDNQVSKADARGKD